MNLEPKNSQLFPLFHFTGQNESYPFLWAMLPHFPLILLLSKIIELYCGYASDSLLGNWNI